MTTYMKPSCQAFELGMTRQKKRCSKTLSECHGCRDTENFPEIFVLGPTLLRGQVLEDEHGCSACFHSLRLGDALKGVLVGSGDG